MRKATERTIAADAADPGDGPDGAAVAPDRVARWRMPRGEETMHVRKDDL